MRRRDPPPAPQRVVARAKALAVPIREVWVWKRGKLAPYLLRADRYVRAARSKLLPRLDLDLVASFVHHPSQLAAVRALRSALRAR